MSTSKVVYKGDIRTESTHLQSETIILTDGPTDNHGKGEAFSPTDMVANSLATCMFSIMGIKANAMNLDIEGSTADVTKIMQAEPRMISEIVVVLNMQGVNDEKSRIILERSAMTCPVFLSLHPDIKKTIRFNWG
ncbi:OsmC family protein [Paenimyroides viscosum]|uniref:OsmC family peroxiredoxin n=1 Tax=Paenimyroides viscosum TaxID=2488729 RepID=A0A3P1B5P5_9FLAO|nr:OsmC family protein [Paenimyroides viscosum]RRA96467.1 OsmC family peroxiredoxin [Paenimyroides viscosum]